MPEMDSEQPTRTEPLDAVAGRVLGVLVEKQLSTPDYYPLTLNALLAGCNQKSNREPVMNLDEPAVHDALDTLRHRSLVMESYGASGRVLRYSHNLPKVLGIGEASTALLATLLLRSAQTAAELRANTDRLYRFADLSSVEAHLEELANRSAGALVLRLPKRPGEREPRWVQRYAAGDEDEAIATGAPSELLPADVALTEIAALRDEVNQLREEVATLRALVEGRQGCD